MGTGRIIFFFKQKTAYEIYQCDWSSDVCSSDLRRSERYFNDPNQLRLDFKGTDDGADAAEGLAQAVDRKSVV